jgi:hypothetical protein
LSTINKQSLESSRRQIVSGKIWEKNQQMRLNDNQTQKVLRLQMHMQDQNVIPFCTRFLRITNIDLDPYLPKRKEIEIESITI